MICCGILVIACFFQSVAHTDGSLSDEVLLYPESFAANHRLGEYYLRQERLEAAIPYLEKARTLNRGDYTNSYDLALAYLRVGSLDKSWKLVNEMIGRQDAAELHNLLADVDEASGQVMEAAREYERAARMDPTEKNLFDLGSHLLNHQDFKAALTVFNYGIERFPKSARLRVALGVNYYSLGQYAEAVQALCQAVDLDPADTRPLDFLGKMSDLSPQYADEVTNHLATFAHNYPRNAAAEYYYALSLRKRATSPSKTNDQAAEPFLLRAVELNPDFTDAHYELGALYQDLQQDRKAIQQFEIAAKQRPAFLQAHYHLAQLYNKNGALELARQEFSRIQALKASPVQ